MMEMTNRTSENAHPNRDDSGWERTKDIPFNQDMNNPTMPGTFQNKVETKRVIEECRENGNEHLVDGFVEDNQKRLLRLKELTGGEYFKRRMKEIYMGAEKFSEHPFS